MDPDCRPTRRRVSIIAVAWLAPILAVAWGAILLTARNDRLQDTVEAVLTARPVTAQDETWRLEWLANQPKAGSESLGTGRSVNRLLIFVRDSCRPCQLAVIKWAQVIRELPEAERPSVTLVSHDIDCLPQDTRIAESAGLPVSTRRVEDVDWLRYRAGVRSVPLSLLVTTGGDVRLAALGVPSDSVATRALRLPPGVPGPMVTEYQRDTVALTVAPTTVDRSRHHPPERGGSNAKRP